MDGECAGRLARGSVAGQPGVGGQRGAGGAPPSGLSLPSVQTLPLSNEACFLQESQKLGKKKLAKPAVDSVSLPTLHLILKPFAPASPRVGRAPPAVVTGVRVRTGPSRFNRPDARTVDSRYFFKDKRVREKMSEIKTLTLLSSPMACEGPRPVCGAGPRTPLGGQTCGLGRGESLLPSRLHAHRPSREMEANGPHLLVQPPHQHLGGSGRASSHGTSARQAARRLLPEPQCPHPQAAAGATCLCQGP